MKHLLSSITLLLLSTLAFGQVPNTFSSGETISSSKINANFAFLADAMVKGNVIDIIYCSEKVPVLYSDGSPTFQVPYDGGFMNDFPNPKLGWKGCFINNSDTTINLLETYFCLFTDYGSGTNRSGEYFDQACKRTGSKEKILTVEEIIRSKLIVAHTDPFILYQIEE